MRPPEAEISLTQRAYRAILDEICEGRLMPGDHLVQEQLAARFGVSRQPIQQALALLKSDGHVVDAPGRGLTIAALDLETIGHRYTVRIALDALSARLAARRVAASPEFGAALRRRVKPVIDAGAAAIARRDVSEMVRRDVEFHELIYEAAGNPVLSAAAAPQWINLRRVMIAVLRLADRPPIIWRQHAEILELVLRGFPDAAAEVAARHVEFSAGSISAILEKS